MAEVIRLEKGVKIKFNKNGFIVISKEGKITAFNQEGELLPNQAAKENKPVWLKYFTKIGKKERDIVAKWHARQKGKTSPQVEFLSYVADALSCVKSDYRIATLEPSLDQTNNLFFERGAEVCVGLSVSEWQIKADEFSDEYNSALATLDQLFIWYALRIATGKITLEEMCDTPLEDHAHEIEVAGARKIAGFRDGLGNTCKLVKYGQDVALVGASYRLPADPVTDFSVGSIGDARSNFVTGVIVLNQ